MASELIDAFLDVQKNLPDLKKNAINHFGNTYITLDSLLDQVLPLLNERGILLVQRPDNINGVPALTTDFILGNEKFTATVPLILDKDNSQGVGSAITYMRRYSVMSFLGLVADEDDDGDMASKSPTVQRRGRSRVVAAPEPPAPNGAANFS